MPSELTCIRLEPTMDSWLSYDDMKNLLQFISEIIKNDKFQFLIKSDKQKGITYYIYIPSRLLKITINEIFSLCPGINVINDKPNIKVKSNIYQTNLYFKKHYAYPLANDADNENHELSMILSNLSNLNKDFEIIIDTKKLKQPGPYLLRRRILNDHKAKLYDPSIVGYFLKLFNLILISPIFLFRNIDNLLNQNTFPAKNLRLSIVDHQSVTLLDKLYQPLFKTNLTIKIKSRTKNEDLSECILSIVNSFAKKSGYQQFKIRNRHSRDVYSASDIASLFHFSKSDLTSGYFNVSQFKSLPLPSSLRNIEKDYISLGVNNYHGRHNKIKMTYKARQQHLYITGATGTGKSTLIANMIKQDLDHNKGITLIDPHGDLAQEVVDIIPEQRKKDLIYFCPADLKQNLRINLLEVKAKPGTTEYLFEIDQITESILSLFNKIFLTDNKDNHRIEYILRNCILTALNIQDCTIFNVFQLLTDNSYRFKVMPYISDSNLMNFWKNEYGKAGDYQRVKMISGVTSKVGRLLFFEPTKRVFDSPKSTLDIANVIDQNKILICNFSKGSLGEDGSKLFATAILSKIQLAALARINDSAHPRTSHYLYVDEFQNYAPRILIQMLSEIRKYGLYLTIAEQSPSQQDFLSTNALFANIANTICFRTTSINDEKMLYPKFKDLLSSGDLSNMPNYSFYFKSAAEEVWPTTSGQTLPLFIQQNIKVRKTKVHLNRKIKVIKSMTESLKPNLSSSSFK